jgi:hypothetical protein
MPSLSRSTSVRISGHRLRAHVVGRHTAPSDLDDLDADNLLLLSVSWPTTLARSPRTLA